MRFEVFLNGERLCMAGLEFGVLSAILTWVRRNPNGFEKQQTRFENLESYCEETCNLGVHGLDLTNPDSDSHADWEHVEIEPGDVIEIRFLEPGPSDEPSSRVDRIEAIFPAPSGNN